MSRVSRRPAVVMPTEEEDKLILTAAKADPDAQPLSAKQLKEMVPLRRTIGCPKLERRKVLLSVGYSPEVIAFFKSTGEGWQSRMDGLLREYIEKNSRE